MHHALPRSLRPENAACEPPVEARACHRAREGFLPAGARKCGRVQAPGASTELLEAPWQKLLRSTFRRLCLDVLAEAGDHLFQGCGSDPLRELGDLGAIRKSIGLRPKP